MIDDEPKRPRDYATDAIVKAALAEEDRQKKFRKMEKAGGSSVEKKKEGGKTLAEIEDEETGGTVKESLVGMAQVKRADKRKVKGVVKEDELEIPDEVEKFEEDVEAEEEGLMPFNLKEEREEGDFDELGNYVERKKTEEDKDAWMDSKEAQVVSEEVRKKIEQRRAAEERESARQAPLTDRQIAALKMELAGLMQEGETISRTLKRLGGAAGVVKKAMGKREKQRAAAAAAAAAAAGGEAAAGRDAFEKVVTVADQLLVEGETDIYSATKEELERSAAMWLPKASIPKPPAPAGGSATATDAAAFAAPAAAADDDDMFGADDNALDNVQAAAPPTTAAEATVLPSPSSAPVGRAAGRQEGSFTAPAPASAPVAASSGASVATGAAQEGEDIYSSWPIKELKRFLQERGVDSSNIVEKGELVKKVQEVAAKGPDGAADAAFTAPAGYVFDPQSGYFSNPETGMYYDTSSGAYYHSASGKWLRKEGHSFVEWKQ